VTKNQLQDCLLSKGSNEILSSHLLLHSQWHGTIQKQHNRRCMCP
jgi:hypothetical protein